MNIHNFYKMGQNESNSSLPDAVESIPSNIIRQAKTLTEISALTYNEFLQNLDELNSLSSRCMDAQGRQLVFAIEKDTDSSLLWKATIRIACYRFNPDDDAMERCRLLNLAQFVKIFKSLKNELSTAQQIDECEETARIAVSNLLQKVASSEDLCSARKKSSNESCIICFDREQEITLPCTHSFCQKCIDQWYVNNNTCPVCRQVSSGRNEEWVLSNAPNIEEISEHIVASLMDVGLA